MAVTSQGCAPALARTVAIAGASSSPCRLASTADSHATTSEPSCAATVTAGVAVSNARMNTVSQPSHRDDVTGPPGISPRTGRAGLGNSDGGQRLYPAQRGSRELERARLELADRDRAESVSRVTLNAYRDKHVPVPREHNDLLGRGLAVEGLQCADRLLSEARHRRDGRWRLRRALRRLEPQDALPAELITGVRRRAAVARSDQARSQCLQVDVHDPEDGTGVDRERAFALRLALLWLNGPRRSVHDLVQYRGAGDLAGVRHGAELTVLQMSHVLARPRRGLRQEDPEAGEHDRSEGYRPPRDQSPLGPPAPGSCGPAAPRPSSQPSRHVRCGPAVFAWLVESLRLIGPRRRIPPVSFAHPRRTTSRAERLDAGRARPGRQIGVFLKTVVEGVDDLPAAPARLMRSSRPALAPRVAGTLRLTGRIALLGHGTPPRPAVRWGPARGRLAAGRGGKLLWIPAVYCR